MDMPQDEYFEQVRKAELGATSNGHGTPLFINHANDTLQRLKDGIKAINELPSPAARTTAQFSLRGELGLDPTAYKQVVQDLLEEQKTPAPASFDELMKLDTGKEASIEVLAAKGTLTLVAAERHGGKTSLFYRMAEAISTGENFAGRFKSTQGTALIYQVDESPTDAINKFRRMSIAPDSSRFLPRWKLSPAMIPELEQEIQLHKPVAVFADSLMRIFGGRGISLNDAELGIWLYQLNNIASRYGTSFFLSHHRKSPTANSDHASPNTISLAPLSSTTARPIAGGCIPLKPKGHRNMSSAWNFSSPVAGCKTFSPSSTSRAVTRITAGSSWAFRGSWSHWKNGSSSAMKSEIC